MGEFLRVEAEEVPRRRVEIVLRYLFLDRVVAELVGGAMDVAGLESAAGKPGPFGHESLYVPQNVR